VRGPKPRRKGHTIPELRVAGWGFATNALWEALQTPLYTDRGRGALYLVRTRIHCTVGDVLILLGCYAAVSLLWRDRHWIATRRIAPRVLFVMFGFGYTIFSEVLHTRWLESWAYAPEMPLLLGIGTAPLLQWIVIPSLLLAVLGPPKEPEFAASPEKPEPRLVVDPVCGSRVRTEGANQFFDGEHTIYFCSPECRRSHIECFRARKGYEHFV
jgi:YHS domain-containing protein